MDGWADYEGEVSRYQDRFPKDQISLEVEAIPPTKSKNQEVKKIEEQISPSKSTSSTK